MQFFDVTIGIKIPFFYSFGYYWTRLLLTTVHHHKLFDKDLNYRTLLLHVEVRWFSRGQSSRRLLLLKEKIEMFWPKKNVNFLFFFNDMWLSRLCYLLDIFAKLNDLNLVSSNKDLSYIYFKW